MKTWHIVINWSEDVSGGRVKAQKQIDFEIQGSKREAIERGVKRLLNEYSGLIPKVESINIFELEPTPDRYAERAWRKER